MPPSWWELLRSCGNGHRNGGMEDGGHLCSVSLIPSAVRSPALGTESAALSSGSSETNANGEKGADSPDSAAFMPRESDVTCLRLRGGDY